MFLHFHEFADIAGLQCLISTREGGVSAGDFGALNLGYHVGDDQECVSENRRRLAQAAGYDPASLVAAQQVHGTELAWVGMAERGRGAFGWDDAIPATDGLLVRDAQVPIAIQVADCAPVLLVDPVQHVLAVVHAGWRGALGGITAAAVRRMVTDAGTDPAQVRVGIGPTLCPACLEVGEEVADAVAQAVGDGPICRGAVRPHLDIRTLITTDLRTVGVAADQVVAHSACSRCRNDLFFSHRGQHGRAGRFALVAWWE